MKKIIKLFAASMLIGTTVAYFGAETHAQGGETEVRIAIGTDIDSLDPFLAQATLTESIIYNVFEGLLDAETDGSVTPHLAHDYDISDDGLVYTFYLEEDVMFHDGSEMTADDVVYTYSKLAGLDDGEVLSDKWDVVEAVTAIDDYTVEVTLESPDSGFLARTITAIAPADYEDHAVQPIGTGPYEFVNHSIDQRVTLQKFDDYFQGNDFDVDVVHFEVMADEETALLAFQAGEIDFITAVSNQNLERVDPDATVVSGPLNMVMMLALNHEVEPLNNLEVRQAMSMVVNKQEIIDVSLDGQGDPLDTLMSPVMDFYINADTADYYAEDVEEALALMESAGYTDGFEIEMRVPNNAQVYIDASQVLQAQLAQINVDVTLDVIEFSTWLDQVYNERNFETTIIGFTGKLDPYDVMVRMQSDYAYNFMNVDIDGYDDALEAAISAQSPEDSVEHYHDAQMLVTEHAAAVFLMDPARNSVFRSGITGFEMYPYERYVIKDLVVE